MNGRWQNQQEAMDFALGHSAVMLDLDMGCGKTRVALDTTLSREDTRRILIVCPKAVIPVWRENLLKFHDNEDWFCWDGLSVKGGTIALKAQSIWKWLKPDEYTTPNSRYFVVVNYDIVWRAPLGNMLLQAGFDTVIASFARRVVIAAKVISEKHSAQSDCESPQVRRSKSVASAVSSQRR